MRRLLGLVAGPVTHILFAVTVWKLYGFLKGGHGGASPAGAASLCIDALLCASFGVVHSALLYPKVRKSLTQWIAAPFYGLFYSVVNCSGLLGLFASWTTSPAVWWEVTGPARSLIQAAWYGSWALLIYSLWLSGFGYQTGGTPWWHWVHRRPLPPRPFHPRGPFLWIRHPAYLGFLGLVWFTPAMTADRAILIGTWTVYVLVGSWLKDERLAHYMGAPYRMYQSQVAGYPGISIGPLAKRRFDLETRLGDAVTTPISSPSTNRDAREPRKAETVSSAQ